MGWARNSMVFFLLMMVLGRAHAQSEKGVWLTDVASPALDSPEGIAEVVLQCKRYGLDKIYVVVWNAGHTLYPSKIMHERFGRRISERFAGKNMLKELIEMAHKAGIEVHAWFEFGFSSSYHQVDGGHILREKPQWKAIDRYGKLVTKNKFQWMNAFHPEVQDFLISLIKEVIINYDIDGIQGDDRLPACPSTAGYDPYTLALYAQDHEGEKPPNNYKDPEWIRWRAQLLNQFAKRLYGEIKAIDPDITISMAPSAYPWSLEEYLQDWPTWVREGHVDAIIPQMYRYSIKAYRETLQENLGYMPTDSQIPFVPGILLRVGEYQPTNGFLRKMIKTNRQLGLDSEVFFFYEGLRPKSKFFSKTYNKY